MKPSNYRKLQSHTTPVRQLFRCLLRNTTHLPLSQNDISLIRTQVINQFKTGRSQMSVSLIKSQLENAYLWNNHIYNTLLPAQNIESQTSLSWIKSQLDKHKTAMKQQQLARPIEINPKPSGEDLLRLQILSRFTLARNRMLRSYKSKCRVSSKADLDDTYINTILVPEYFGRKQHREISRRKRSQLLKPRTAQIKFVPTAIGIMHFLRAPSKRPSAALSRIIRDGIHSDLLKKIDELEEMKVLAQYEADWESKLDSDTSLGSNSPLAQSMENSRVYKQYINQWYDPLNESIKTIQKRINRKRKREKIHARTLVSRKRLIDAVYQAKYQNYQWKWQKYQQLRSQSPAKFMVHYDVTKMMY